MILVLIIPGICPFLIPHVYRVLKVALDTDLAISQVLAGWGEVEEHM